MAVRDALLPEFDHEMAVTRRILERLPAPALEWKPHERSYSLGGLAAHLADIPHWGTRILDRDFHDLLQGRGNRDIAPPSVAGILETFDRHVAEVRRSLLERSDAELMAPWSLRRGDHLVMSLPKIAALRSFLLHHLIHHRGQLTVYLRLQGVALPPLYGPTADEDM